MSIPMRFSYLSPARQMLVRLCQSINFGSVENLRVESAEPVFNPPPMLLKDVKLDSDEAPRSEMTLVDFVLGDEVLRLLRLLDDMRLGTVRRIEVRAGIPRRILWETPGTISAALISRASET
jgi:hypothetical protein